MAYILDLIKKYILIQKILVDIWKQKYLTKMTQSNKIFTKYWHTKKHRKY